MCGVGKTVKWRRLGVALRRQGFTGPADGSGRSGWVSGPGVLGAQKWCSEEAGAWLFQVDCGDLVGSQCLSGVTGARVLKSVLFSGGASGWLDRLARSG